MWVKKARAFKDWLIDDINLGENMQDSENYYGFELGQIIHNKINSYTERIYYKLLYNFYKNAIKILILILLKTTTKNE